jgi:hypothetical protein
VDIGRQRSGGRQFEASQGKMLAGEGRGKERRGRKIIFILFLQLYPKYMNTRHINKDVHIRVFITKVVKQI